MIKPFKLDSFLQALLSYLAETLEEVVGLENSSGFIAIVGQQIGEEVNQHYQNVLGSEALSAQQVANTLVDFKKQIEGDFYIIEQTDDKIVLGNRHCPFNHFVEGHPSLCMMTSSVFGVVAAQNIGYAKVAIQRAIAQGDKECLVTIYLQKSEEAKNAVGREYYRVR